MATPWNLVLHPFGVFIYRILLIHTKICSNSFVFLVLIFHKSKWFANSQLYSGMYAVRRIIVLSAVIAFYCDAAVQSLRNSLLHQQQSSIAMTSLPLSYPMREFRWIRPLGTNFSEISIGIHSFSFKKMRLNVSPAQLRPCCLGLNVLNAVYFGTQPTGKVPSIASRSPFGFPGFNFFVTLCSPKLKTSNNILNVHNYGRIQF